MVVIVIITTMATGMRFHEISFRILENFEISLVTQAKLQRRPNRAELRSMDSYNQIFSRFQKYKRKVPPPSPLFGRKKPVV